MVTSGEWKRPAIIAPTAADARDIMIEGESGLLAVHPHNERPVHEMEKTKGVWSVTKKVEKPPKYEPSKRRLTWPNGAVASIYSAEEPDRLRGPNHDGAWADEIASWKRPETWDNMTLGLRIGDNPQVVATTTPRPKKLIRDLVAEESTIVVGGTTYDNRAFLAKKFFEIIISRYEGTTQGKQELLGLLLTETPGALFTRNMMDDARVIKHPELERIVIAIDPATTSKPDSDETGIIVAGVAGRDAYILEDLTCRKTPLGWARTVVGAYYRWEADVIIGEVNQGGDLVETTIRSVNENVHFQSVHAKRGKHLRAEPVQGLYEQRRVKHLEGLELVEDQLCMFTGEDAEELDDRVDALVYAVTDLLLDNTGGGQIRSV